MRISHLGDVLNQLESEPISVLILDHIQSTVRRLGDGLFSQIGTGPKVPIICVSTVSPLVLARQYQDGCLLYILNLISD